MANIEINEVAWNSLSDDEKNQVTLALRSNNLLSDTDSIIGNPNLPVEEVNESWLSDAWDSNKKEICKIGCDAAAAAAAASLTLTGPGLAAALAAIEVARQACRNSC